MSTHTPTQNETAYGIGLSNAWPDEHRRLHAAQELADPATFRHLETIGIRPGLNCLEVGGGCGSVARFMAERVGPSGSVVVTDLDTRRLEDCDLPNVEVLVHDVGTDPVAEGVFDIVHARLVLEHLPNRLSVLRKLKGALRPGGWLLIEDFDHSSLLHLPARHQFFSPPALGPKYQRPVFAAQALAPTSGIDLEFGRELPRHLFDAGLVDVDAEVNSPLVRGGTLRSDYYRLSLLQAAPALVGTGLVTEDDVDDVVAALDSPDTMLLSTPMVSAWGRQS